jgi:hypothetical protein
MNLKSQNFFIYRTRGSSTYILRKISIIIVDALSKVNWCPETLFNIFHKLKMTKWGSIFQKEKAKERKAWKTRKCK